MTMMYLLCGYYVESTPTGIAYHFVEIYTLYINIFFSQFFACILTQHINEYSTVTVKDFCTLSRFPLTKTITKTLQFHRICFKRYTA